MSSLSIFDILKEVSFDEITMHEISKSIRQFLRRSKKISHRKMGSQRSWLMVMVPSNIEISSRSERDWLSTVFETICGKMPNSSYKALASFIAQNSQDSKIVKGYDGIFWTSVDEGLQIIAMPAFNVIAFNAPPGNLKSSLEFYGYLCEWNWSIGNNFNSLEIESIETGHSEEFKTDLSKLHEKYGEGERATIAVIDSGIFKDSIECEDRVIWQGEQFFWGTDGEVNTRTAAADFTPISSHGTRVASIAAGGNIGIAPKADLVSIAVPIDSDDGYRPLSLFLALNKIYYDDGTALGTDRLASRIDVILIPSGFPLEGKMAPEFKHKVCRNILMKLYEDHEINIVASIGNITGKVGFPSSFQFVHSVGFLTCEGLRHPKSGYGTSTTSGTLPNYSVVGENILSESFAGDLVSSTGSSFAAAVVAGYFALIASKHPTSAARATKIASACKKTADGVGELKVLNPASLL